MSESNIMQYILELKDKLEALDKAYQAKLKSTEMRENNLKHIENKLQEVQQLQNNIITFNVGGEFIRTNRQIIINSIYDSILKEFIDDLTKMNKPLTDLTNIFIDRNPEYIKYILDIIRTANEEYIKNNCDINFMTSIPFYVNSDQCCIDLLNLEIDFYFKQDAEKVFDHFKFMYSNKPNNVSSDIVNSVLNVNVSNILPSEELNKYRASTFKDISKINSKKAYFISYDSTITFELDSEKELESIDIKPFTADLNFWIPCEGAGAFCFTSLSENGEYDFLSSIPEDFGLDFEDNKKTYKIYFDRRRVKFIRFQTGDFTLSISYIRFNYKS